MGQPASSVSAQTAPQISEAPNGGESTAELVDLGAMEDVPRGTEDLPQELDSSEEAQEKPEEAPRKFKRKVNGKLVEVTEDELWKHYGLEQTAQERLKEAARVREEAEALRQTTALERDQLAQFLYEMKERPEVAFSLLSEMGHDAKQIARQMVLRELEWEKMSPEQRELEELRQYRAQREEEEKLRKEEETRARIAQEEAKAFEEVDELITETLKLSGLHPKPKTVARLAEACQTLFNKSGKLPSPEEIIRAFRSYVNQDYSELYSEQDIEKLIDLGVLNDKSMKKIADWVLKQGKEKLPSFSPTKSGSSENKKASKSNKKMNMTEWFNKL